MTTLPMAPLKAKDYASNQDVRWCPGCGDYAILSAVQKTMADLAIPREDIVFVSGIGCSSRFPYYMNTYGFHTVHGRAPTLATGLKLANPELAVFVITGDGDALSIGGNHILHVLRRNVDLTILLFNNRIYGLTKGQYSPTSELGKVTKSTPFGGIDPPLDPISVALAARATFVARTVDRNVSHMQYVIKRAVAHKGTSFVEIYQNCNIFNDGAFAPLTDKATKSDTVVEVRHGETLCFGADDNRRAVNLHKLHPSIVSSCEEALDNNWVYDETDLRQAVTLASLPTPEFPVPIGVLYAVEATEYVSAHMAQEQAVCDRLGEGDVAQLLRGTRTWSVP